MVSLKQAPFRLASALFATGMLVTAGATVARPGAVNYAEGSVTVAGQAVGAKQIGQTEVEPGQVLSTQTGKAEMLLTPGVVLRIGDNSSVRMKSASLTDTRVELLRGEAVVEAAQVLDANRIAVTVGGFDARIEKKGIYRFEADRPTVAVYDGKATVLEGDRTIDIGKGKEFTPGADTKPRKFDRSQTDALYAWSKVRSNYLAEANQATVQTLVVGGPGWYGAGWYWNPWYRSFAFVPADGYLFSPFGYGFYSPTYFYSWGPAFRGPVFRGPVYRPVIPSGRIGIARGVARPLGRGARM